MEYKKPQATIIQGNVGIYPLTTADQVILADGTRLEKDGKINVNVANSADSAKLGGKAPEYYLQPRNLLDNSDFRNPVNQRGQTNYTLSAWGGYCIDRWHVGGVSTTLMVNDNDCTLSGDIYQTIDQNSNGKNLNGKTVTIAAKVNGIVTCSSGNIAMAGEWAEFAAFPIQGGRVYIHANSDNVLDFGLTTDGTVTIEWAALYEGSYTAETLPPYVPKGYATELAECLRYFERLGETFSDALGNAVYAASNAASIIISIHYSPKRIKHPTIVMSDTSQYRVLLKDATNCNTYSAFSLSAFGDIDTENSFGQIKVAMAGNLSQDSWVQLQRSDGATAAYIDVSADL